MRACVRPSNIDGGERQRPKHIVGVDRHSARWMSESHTSSPNTTPGRSWRSTSSPREDLIVTHVEGSPASGRMSMEPRARSAQDRVDGCNAITTTEPGIVVTENEVAGELATDDREHAIEQLLELGGAAPSTVCSPNRSNSTSTRSSRPRAVPSRTASATRSAPTSGAPTAGPSSSPGSSTPTSPASSSSSRPAAPPRSQPLRGHSPPESTASVGNHVSPRMENSHVRSLPIRHRRQRECRLSRSR
jgi:hypothetical protein